MVTMNVWECHQPMDIKKMMKICFINDYMEYSQNVEIKKMDSNW